MNKKNTITLRLTDDQLAWLGALSRRSKRSKSEVIRSLIEHGSVRERITCDHLHIIRQLIGESTNLNQLAKQANTTDSLPWLTTAWRFRTIFHNSSNN